jgi:hypothetical protein
MQLTCFIKCFPVIKNHEIGLFLKCQTEHLSFSFVKPSRKRMEPLNLDDLDKTFASLLKILFFGSSA